MLGGTAEGRQETSNAGRDSRRKRGNQ